MADELSFSGERGRGSHDERVRRIQEWLCLHGLHVAIDGQFGPATEAAVAQFQKAASLPESGIVNETTFEALTNPMRRAVAHVDADGLPLGEVIVACAQRHLSQHPREIGGDNRGPWVRLYMDGNEGPDWYWCAGFACFILRTACAAAGVPAPPTTYSCDTLARNAQRAHRFVGELDIQRDLGAKKYPAAGSFFLNRAADDDWTHVGIVIGASGERFDTIEGNTNDDGSRNGYEVCRRARGYGSKDFINWT